MHRRKSGQLRARSLQAPYLGERPRLRSNCTVTLGVWGLRARWWIMARPSEEPQTVSTVNASASFRDQLTVGEDVIDPTTWAGSIPAVNGVAPRIRIGRDRWFNLLWLIPIGFATALVMAVAVAKGLRDTTAVAAFIERHPGAEITPQVERNAGLPAWVGVQHFFNLFLMIFILRSGIQILTDHPRLYWTRHSTPGKDWFRIQKPVPADPLWTAKKDSISLPEQVGLPGLRHSIGLARWWHLGVDVLWLANGLVFYVLMFATGQWRRIVPTTWDVFPDALSVLIQYLSLDWPTETGWVAYNGLQLLAYFVTVFVAAPLALITGLGMSPALSTRFRRISRCSASRPPARCTSSCWCGSWSSSSCTSPSCSRPGCCDNLNHIYAARTRRQLERLLDLRWSRWSWSSSAGSRRRRSRCATRGSSSVSGTR